MRSGGFRERVATHIERRVQVRPEEAARGQGGALIACVAGSGLTSSARPGQGNRLPLLARLLDYSFCQPYFHRHWRRTNCGTRNGIWTNGREQGSRLDRHQPRQRAPN